MLFKKMKKKHQWMGMIKAMNHLNRKLLKHSFPKGRKLIKIKNEEEI